MAELDERSIGDRTRSPKELVLKLAHAKAEHLVPRLKQELGPDREHFLITCDQVVVSHEGAILEKPIDANEVGSALLQDRLDILLVPFYPLCAC